MSILTDEIEERMPTLEDLEKAIHGKLPLDHAPSTCHFAAKAAYELLQSRFDESIANCARCHKGPRLRRRSQAVAEAVPRKCTIASNRCYALNARKE